MGFIRDVIIILILSFVGGIVAAIFVIKSNMPKKKQYDFEEDKYKPQLQAVEGKSYSYEVGSKTYGYNGWEKTKVVEANKIKRYFTPVYKYKVTGINPLTNRRKSAIVVIEESADLSEIEKKSGLIKVSNKEKILEPPTQKQMSYAKDLGISISNDMTKGDLACIIHRLLDVNEPFREAWENAEEPSKILWDKVIARNEWCSAYTSELGLVESYFFTCPTLKDKLIFYLALMYCKQNNIKDYNIWILPVYNTISEIADELSNDESFCKSFSSEGNIKGEDLILSNYYISRRNKAGKMAWASLRDRGLVSGEPQKRKYSL